MILLEHALKKLTWQNWWSTKVNSKEIRYFPRWERNVMQFTCKDVKCQEVCETETCMLVIMNKGSQDRGETLNKTRRRRKRKRKWFVHKKKGKENGLIRLQREVRVRVKPTGSLWQRYLLPIRNMGPFPSFWVFYVISLFGYIVFASLIIRTMITIHLSGWEIIKWKTKFWCQIVNWLWPYQETPGASYERWWQADVVTYVHIHKHMSWNCIKCVRQPHACKYKYM